MEVGDYVVIMPTDSLAELKLMALCGKRATISELCFSKNGEIHGAWVFLTGFSFQGEQEWYIPFNSLIYDNY